jgi:hypothetical protein
MLTWVACYIEDQLKRTSSPQKKYLIGELAKQYCIGKEIKGPNDGLAITTTSSNQQEVTTAVPSPTEPPQLQHLSPRRNR